MRPRQYRTSIPLFALLLGGSACVLESEIPTTVNLPHLPGRGSSAPKMVIQDSKSPKRIRAYSSHPLLQEGFAWAESTARSFVQTGKGANIPSYWAGLQDRPAFYLRDFVHQATGAHLLGLDLENSTMLRVFAESATESRLYYPLWAFDFTGKPFEADYRSDTHFTRELPAPFELVEKSYRLFQWTGDRAYFNDPTTWKYHSQTVTKFLDAHREDGNPVTRESGTGETHLGVASYNESNEKLTYAGDAIASQYQALLTYSKMLTENGDFALSAQFQKRARKLKAILADQWWADSRYQYFRGFSEDGPLSGWGREASWFLPMKFITEPGDRNNAYLKFIDESVEMKNIEAYTYLPEVFFPYGFDEQGWKWMKHLIGSRSDYPEVSFTWVSHTVEGLMGVEADAARDAVATLPHLPEEIEWLEVDHIPMGQHDLSVRHEGRRRTSVYLHRGTDSPKSLHWTARFPGSFKKLRVNDRLVDAVQGELHGVAFSAVSASVPLETLMTVEAPEEAADTGSRRK